MTKLHLVGIGGVGMSALAEALMDTGTEVSGSERFLDQGRPLPVLDVLRRQGAAIYPQDGSGVTPNVEAVVISSAIESDNPDIAAAARLGIPVLHRSQALAKALAHKKLIAVAGTCGKSTITGMLGHILEVAGLSPAVVNGAPCVNWCSTQRTGAVLRGSGEICVAEVDESDKSLLNFHPVHALISNCSEDHFCLTESNDLFDKFLSQVSGQAIDGRSDPEPIPEITEKEWSCEFPFRGRVITLPHPGRHNALNTWQACRMAEILGVSPDTCVKAMASFHGIKRRMELVGTMPNGVRVIDEYAHNTEKIRAALKTLQTRSTRTLALWRPHGYGPLEKMLDSLTAMFIETLRPDDILFLLPVFDVGGTAKRTIRCEALHDCLVAAGVLCELLPDHASVISRIKTLVAPGDVIVTMGARDPEIPETAVAFCSAPCGQDARAPVDAAHPDGSAGVPPACDAPCGQDARAPVDAAHPDGSAGVPPASFAHSPFYNPFSEIDVSKHKLPHWNQSDCFCFVTWRLNDAMPEVKLAEWETERAVWLTAHPEPWNDSVENEYHQRFSNRVDEWLDAGHGECLLRNPYSRKIVADALVHFDSERYTLAAFVIMPNHVHVLLKLQAGHALGDILHSWKSFTAKAINKTLNRTGVLWQPEYWDRLIRSERHFEACVDYIRNNPVKTRLPNSNYTMWERPSTSGQDARAPVVAALP